MLEVGPNVDRSGQYFLFPASTHWGKPRFPAVPLANLPPRPVPGRCRGRPRVLQERGDIVCVGGVDGVYVSRLTGTKGRGHLVRTELSSVGLSGRRGCLRLVYGPVAVLLPLQLDLDLPF